MKIAIRPYETPDEAQVIALWRRCCLVVPWNDPQEDIRLKLQIQPELFLVGVVDDSIVATIMAGYEGHRGWLNYLAVAPERQGQGIGRQMVEAAETRLKAIGCPKINLQIRATNQAVIAFYERLGFQVDHSISMGRRLDTPRSEGKVTLMPEAGSTTAAQFIRVAPIGDTDTNALPVRDIGPAVGYYTQVLGFSLVSRESDRAVLARDAVTIGLEKNDADPEQASCYFAVSDVDALHREIEAKGIEPSPIRVDEYGGNSYRVFFAREPYGVCFCFGQPV